MDKQPEYLFVCPWCGTPYMQGEDFFHGTYGACQERERHNEKVKHGPLKD